MQIRGRDLARSQQSVCTSSRWSGLCSSGMARQGLTQLRAYPLPNPAYLGSRTNSSPAAGFASWRLSQEVTPGGINSSLRVLRRCLRLAASGFDRGCRDELHRMRWEQVAWPNAGKRGTILVIKGKTAAARRSIPMTPRVHATFESRWKAQGKPAAGWVWPAPTKTGHIDHSTI